MFISSKVDSYTIELNQVTEITIDENTQEILVHFNNSKDLYINCGPARDKLVC